MKKLCPLAIAAAMLLGVAAPAQSFENVTAQTAYTMLATGQAVMIDVRTVDEWAWVGHPGKNKTGVGAEIADAVFNIAYEIEKPGKGYELITNNLFMVDVESAVPDKYQPIITICRSGGRSVSAAIALEAAGYVNVYNTLKGFEGGTDADGHRTKAEGWKNTGLPYAFGYAEAYDHVIGN